MDRFVEKINYNRQPETFFIPTRPNAEADFCLNRCPYEECKKGTCPEFREFKKKLDFNGDLKNE